MHFFKRKMVGKKSERGFVLIIALIGIMILLAVGFFALTVSTSDLRIATRLAGERKAFSAAEAGVHAICTAFTGDLAVNNKTNQPVDSVNDPHSFYDVTGSAVIPGMSQTCSSAFSIEGGITWSCNNYAAVVTGRNTDYDSSASIAIGVKGKASPDTPGYDFN